MCVCLGVPEASLRLNYLLELRKAVILMVMVFFFFFTVKGYRFKLVVEKEAKDKQGPGDSRSKLPVVLSQWSCVDSD